MSMRRLLPAVLTAVALAPVWSIERASAQDMTQPQPVCAAPDELVSIGAPLWRLRAALAADEPVVIVAIGSSSTSGAGASAPQHSYPARLEAELRQLFPAANITVLNRGVNGEVTRDMLSRFEAMVIRERPDLVLWQVGTNAVLRDHVLAQEAPLIRTGIHRLKAAYSDVVLIDPQYAPKVLAKPDVRGMVDLMATTARNEGTGLFRRFAVMRHWREAMRIPFEAALSPDGLHMNDWSYACVARLLARAIADAVRAPAGIARAPGRK